MVKLLRLFCQAVPPLIRSLKYLKRGAKPLSNTAKKKNREARL
jgi:hypothetical protein